MPFRGCPEILSCCRVDPASIGTTHGEEETETSVGLGSEKAPEALGAGGGQGPQPHGRNLEVLSLVLRFDTFEAEDEAFEGVAR